MFESYVIIAGNETDMPPVITLNRFESYVIIAGNETGVIIRQLSNGLRAM